MKTSIAVFGALLLFTSHVFGASASSTIVQRARELNQQNNVRQGVPSPTQPVSPPSAAPQPQAPALTPSLAKFQSDLAGITLGAQVSADVKQRMAQQLVAGAQGAKPALATARKFVDNLAAANVEKPLPPSSRARLVQELDAVLNPGKFPNAKLDGIFADVQAIFQANGMSRSKAAVLADNVKALSTEIQQGGAKSP